MVVILVFVVVVVVVGPSLQVESAKGSRASGRHF